MSRVACDRKRGGTRDQGYFPGMRPLGSAIGGVVASMIRPPDPPAPDDPEARMAKRLEKLRRRAKQAGHAS